MKIVGVMGTGILARSIDFSLLAVLSACCMKVLNRRGTDGRSRYRGRITMAWRAVFSFLCVALHVHRRSFLKASTCVTMALSNGMSWRCAGYRVSSVRNRLCSCCVDRANAFITNDGRVEGGGTVLMSRITTLSGVWAISCVGD